MSFELPNLDDAAYPHQARVYSTDWTILGACAGGRTGVISGGLVTEAGSPAMSVEVEEGRANFNGTPLDFNADGVVITAADGTDPRWDLITVDSGGDINLWTGTADPSPVPSNPAGLAIGTEVALAYVYVPASDTTIVDNQIVDKRVFVQEPLGASEWNTITAPSNLDRVTTATASADSALTFPMIAGATYRLRWNVHFIGNPAAAVGGTVGAKVGFGGPASPSYIQVNEELLAGVANSTLQSTASMRLCTVYDTAALLTNSSGLLRWSGNGVITNGSNAGDFALFWAQSASHANLTRRILGSWLEYEVV